MRPLKTWYFRPPLFGSYVVMNNKSYNTSSFSGTLVGNFAVVYWDIWLANFVSSVIMSRWNHFAYRLCEFLLDTCQYTWIGLRHYFQPTKKQVSLFWGICGFKSGMITMNKVMNVQSEHFLCMISEKTFNTGHVNWVLISNRKFFNHWDNYVTCIVLGRRLLLSQAHLSLIPDTARRCVISTWLVVNRVTPTVLRTI